MLTGELLDDGGRGVSRALIGIWTALAVLLFVALCVPLVIIGGVLGGVAGIAAALPVPGHPAVESVQRVNLAQPIATHLPAASSAAVEVARRYLGVPYLFGGADPTIGLDCSGLVQLVFRQLGIQLPHSAQLQSNASIPVPRDQLQPGDLVFFARTYAHPTDWITHVGIYIGEGFQISAPNVGQVVSIQPAFSGFWGSHFAGGGRVDPG